MQEIDPARILETPRLLLEPLVAEHAVLLYKSLLDSRLYQFIPGEPCASPEALEDRYRTLSFGRSPDGREAWLNWAMHLRGSNVYGCERIVTYLCREIGIALIFAHIDTRNAASIGLAESLGFQRMVRMSGVQFFKGSVSDEYRYELTCET
jgi:RimJ/RimL family protein N-acetyltransferase